MPTQKLICANRIAPVDTRTDTKDGTEHLVVENVTVGKPMELDGGFIPEDVWERTQSSWNGAPLPVGHPTDAWGNNVTANHPDIEENAVIGRFYNAQLDKQSGELHGELWLNVEKARGLGGHAESAVEQVINGQGLDVSTAYEGEPGEPGVYDGQHRNDVIGNLYADHIALLPDALGPGRCTLEDGCGVPADVAATEVAVNTSAEDEDAAADAALFVNTADADACACNDADAETCACDGGTATNEAADGEITDLLDSKADDETRGVIEAIRDIVRLSSNDTSGRSDETADSDAPGATADHNQTDPSADADAEADAEATAADTEPDTDTTTTPMTDDNDNDIDIERLAEQTPFDPATLTEMPDGQLEYIAANAEDDEQDPGPEDQDIDPDDADDDDPDDTDAHAESERDVGDRDADAEDDVNANAEVTSKLDALADQLDGLEDKFATKDELDQKAERLANSDDREKYIQTILANGSEDEWDESELREKDTDDLRRLHGLAGGVNTNNAQQQQTGADFGLQPTAPADGGVNTNSDDDDDDDGPSGPKTAGTMADYRAQKEGGD